MLLEFIFVLEAIAAPHLHTDRFLPQTPVRVVISHKLADVTEAFRNNMWEAKLQQVNDHIPPAGNTTGLSTASGTGDGPATIPSPAGWLAADLERPARNVEVRSLSPFTAASIAESLARASC